MRNVKTYNLKLNGQIEQWIQFSSVQFSSVQSLSRVRLFATPWIAARQACLSITNSRSLSKLSGLDTGKERISKPIEPQESSGRTEWQGLWYIYSEL